MSSGWSGILGVLIGPGYDLFTSSVWEFPFHTRGGPLEIPGGGQTISSAGIFFFSRSWQQDFFFQVEGFLNYFLNFLIMYVRM